MNDGSYKKETGNVVYDGDLLYYSRGYRDNSHSALVETGSRNIAEVVVVSKWGKYGVYRHNAYYCPDSYLRYGIEIYYPVSEY